MSSRFIICGSIVVIIAGCSGTRSGASLDQMNGQLDEIERSRQGGAEPSAGHGRSDTVFHLASYRDNDFRASANAGARFALWTAPGDDESAATIENTSTQTTQTPRRPGPLPGLWDTIKRDVKAMPSDLWRDTKKVYTSVPNLLILGLSYGGSLAVQATGPDDTIEDGLRGHDIFSDGANDAFAALGNPGTHFALAGAWYLVGQQTQDEKTYNVGKKLFSALIINGTSTMLGQMASWDDAPNGEWGTFPSGHTSSTFCFASVMHEEYGPLAGIPLYGLGALVAMERLDDDEHYLSDVLMGAVLGMVVGHTVAGEKELEIFGGKVVPYADPNTGSTGVAWVKSIE